MKYLFLSFILTILILVPLHHTYADITTGLIGHYKFDETSGTTASDSSGSGNNGTLTGGPTWSTGQIDGALSFDGTDDYVDVGDINLTNAFTLSAWFNPSQLDVKQAIFGKNFQTYQLFITPGNGIRLQRNSAISMTYNPGFITNAWNHVAITFSSVDGAVMYYNGTSVDSDANTDITLTNNVITKIGTIGWTPQDFFTGSIDDVRIYNRVLTQAEIMELYNYTGDTTSPERSNAQPTGTLPQGTANITMSLTTNEGATCRYSTNPGTSYLAMSNTFTLTGGTSHSTTLTGLSDGVSYTRYIRCQDSAGNANTTDYTISFSVDIPHSSMIYYVDSNLGDDDNSGTKSSPFKTLNKALQVVSDRVDQGITSDKIYLRGGVYRNDGFSNTERDYTLYNLNLKGTKADHSVISAMPCIAKTPGCVQRESGQWYENVVFDDGMTINSPWIEYNDNIWKTNPGYLNIKWGDLARNIGTQNDGLLTIGARIVLQDGNSLLWEDLWVDNPDLKPEKVLTKAGMRAYDQNTGTLYVWPYGNKDPNTALMESWKGTTPDIRWRHIFEGNMEHTEIKGIEFRLFTNLLGKVNFADIDNYQYLTWEDNLFSYGWKHFFQDEKVDKDSFSLFPRVGWQIRYNVFYRPNREILQTWGTNHVFEYNKIIERNGPWAGGAAGWGALNLRHMDNVSVRYNYINHLGNKWTGSSVIMFELYDYERDGNDNCKWKGVTIEHNFIGKMNGGTMMYLGRSGCRMSDIIIRNNVFAVNPGIGIPFSTGKGVQITSPHNNLQIYNNVFYDVKTPVVVKDDKGTLHLKAENRPNNIDIHDNIFMNSSNNNVIDTRLIPEATIDKNIFFNNSGSSVGSKLIEKDPLFKNPSKFDFRLKSGSPAIQAGPDIGVYDFDSPVPPGTEWWLFDLQPISLQADLNSDGTVNSLDWSIMNNAWNTADPVVDINNDGIVNTVDWSVMNGEWD